MTVKSLQVKENTQNKDNEPTREKPHMHTLAVTQDGYGSR